MNDLNVHTKSPAVYTFGLIADVQHADIPDGHNFNKTRKRYYRNSLVLLREAVDSWNKQNVNCAIQLGDLIDGYSRKGPNGCQGALESALGILDKVNGPVYHMWGNHELYNFTRQQLTNSPLNSSQSKTCSSLEGKAFYSILLHPQLKLIVLDCYEISLLGTEADSPQHKQAAEILTKNPNKDKNNPDGLTGTDRRFVKFNGAVSPSQIQWLKETLIDSADNKQNVIIMGHLPMFSLSTTYISLCWNHEEVMGVLDKYGQCVLCYVAGHDHDGGSARDPAGIVHITMPGIIEVPPNENGYAVARLYDTSFDIDGVGRMPSYSIDLKYPIDSQQWS